MKQPYFVNLAVGLDQFIGTLFGIPADITISGWVGYQVIRTNARRWKVCEKIINAIFRDSTHCRRSIEWDVIRRYYGQ